MGGMTAREGGGAEAPDGAAGITPPHFGHRTARPANSSFTDSVAEHDGHTKRTGIGPSSKSAERGSRAVECIRPFAQ